MERNISPSLWSIYDEDCERIEINLAPQSMIAKAKRQNEIKTHPLKGFRPDNNLKVADKNIKKVTRAILWDETS